MKRTYWRPWREFKEHYNMNDVKDCAAFVTIVLGILVLVPLLAR